MHKSLSHKSKSKYYRTIGSKLKILEYAEYHGKHSAARKYNVNRSQLRQWNKNKRDKNWIDLPPEVKQTMKVQQSKKLGKHELLFNELNEYVSESLNIYNKLSYRKNYRVRPFECITTIQKSSKYGVSIYGKI